MRQGRGIQDAVGGVQVDHFAQQDAVVGQLFAPDHDGLEGQGAFAQTRDHGVAAGFDPLGDGDFALAAQQFDRTHFAQIHAHGVVGAVIGRLGRGLGHGGLGGGGHVGAGRLGGVLFGLDDVDAHFRQHGQGVFDGVRGHFLGREDLVQFLHRDIAARLGLLDELLDAGVRQIEQGPVGIGFGVLRLGLRAHSVCLHDRSGVISPLRRKYNARRLRWLRRSRVFPNRSGLDGPSQCIALGFHQGEGRVVERLMGARLC
ncbi:hypothetical protein D3C80_1235040 [compost metagenome]